jgi:hypothetical protein
MPGDIYYSIDSWLRLFHGGYISNCPGKALDVSRMVWRGGLVALLCSAFKIWL